MVRNHNIDNNTLKSKFGGSLAFCPNLSTGAEQIDIRDFPLLNKQTPKSENASNPQTELA